LWLPLVATSAALAGAALSHTAAALPLLRAACLPAELPVAALLLLLLRVVVVELVGSRLLLPYKFLPGTSTGCWGSCRGTPLLSALIKHGWRGRSLLLSLAPAAVLLAAAVVPDVCR
jgi:hypothetical protein